MGLEIRFVIGCFYSSFAYFMIFAFMIFVFSPIFFFGIMNSVKKSGDKEHREAKHSNGYAPCEQSLSKTHLRARRRGCRKRVKSFRSQQSNFLSYSLW